MIKEKKGITPSIYLCSTMEAIDELYEGGYNTLYDRIYNRSFDSSLIEKVIGKSIEYQDMRSGLKTCISNFIEKNLSFLNIDWKYEAYQDKLLNQWTPETDIPTNEERKIYNMYRNIDLSRIIRLECNLEKVEF